MKRLYSILLALATATSLRLVSHDLDCDNTQTTKTSARHRLQQERNATSLKPTIQAL